MIQDFKVPKKAINILKEPQGKLISKQDLPSLKGKIVSVGDEVTLSLLEQGIEPALAVIDFKIKRQKIPKSKTSILKKFGQNVLTAKNPARFITLDAWDKIKQAVGMNKTRLEISGEEDLLALACFFLFPKNTKILYGQPDQGIVLMEISDKKKQYYADLLVSSAARAHLDTFSGKTVILHHSDPDGMTSAAIFIKYLQGKGVPCVPIYTVDPIIHENVQNEIEKKKPKNLIILDMGGEASTAIRHFSSTIPVLVLDHHHMAKKDFGNALFLNPHMFEIPEKNICPTSALSYKTCGLGDWIAIIGVIGDKGQSQCAGILEHAKNYNADFEYLTDLFSAADSVGKSEEAVKILLKAENPKDILKNKELVEYERAISSEIERLVNEHKEHALELNQQIIFYEVEPKYDMRGSVANKLQAMYPDKIIIIGEIEDSTFSMSCRTERNDIRLPDLIQAAIRHLEKAHGGGHAKAAGCKVLLKDKDVFLSAFLEALRRAQ